MKQQSLVFHKAATIKHFVMGICIIVNHSQDTFQDNVFMDMCIGLFTYCKMEFLTDCQSIMPQQ